nr:HAMP domain-containing sensor histidine kinase [Spirochaetota bacterium]
MQNKNWGIELEGRMMWYKPWPSNEDEKYSPPTDKEIEETYSISGEAVRETLLYFEECGGDTDSLINLLNTHTFSENYHITKDELLDISRWYTNEYYFYFIMFTKKVIGRYDFHYGENSDAQLSVYHKCFEKGFLNFCPWGQDDYGIIVKDQTLGNISGPLLYIEEELKIDATDFLIFLNSILSESFRVNKDFFNNQLFWVSSEFSDFAYEFLKILSNREMFFREAAFHSGMSKLRLVRIIANVPTRYIINVFKNGTNKSNEVFDYDFILKKNENLIIKAEIRNSFDSDKFAIYRKSILLNRGIINIYGFSALISMLYQLNPEKIDNNIFYKDNGFVISFELDLNSYNFLKIYLYSIVISASLNLSFMHYFLMPIILAFINFAIMFFLISGFLKFKILKKITETKLDEINKSSMEQMDALEKTSASLLEERNLLELKVTERTAELADANEKLRELDRAKTDFFANVSHELRTPLTLILAPVEDALSGRELGRENLEMIRRNSLDLLSLINDLLEISRITAGRIKLALSEIDLSEMMKQFCGAMESSAKLKGIALSYISSGQIKIYADRERLSHVISNFFSNSFKFTEPGGKIEVRVRSDETHAILEFRDTGCGIPADKLDTIFDRFTQADTTSTRRHEGTGIGLSIVKELVELHGGE